MEEHQWEAQGGGELKDCEMSAARCVKCDGWLFNVELREKPDVVRQIASVTLECKGKPPPASQNGAQLH